MKKLRKFYNWFTGLFRSEGEINYRLLGCITAVFLVIVVLPVPRSLEELVSRPSPVGYSLQKGEVTITGSMNRILKTDLSSAQAAQKAKVMIGILIVSVFLWGTMAVPLGATDLLIGSLLYIFFILPLDSISKAYMKDAVFFIFGVLAIATGVSSTGLDRRIGILMLSRVKNLKQFCLVFLPVLSVAAGFLSEHALAAILVPVLMRMYGSLCRYHGIKQDRSLAVLLLLGICFALNQGGPGSPAAGGRNAIMVGYFKEYGMPITFLQWVVYSLPFVIIISLGVGGVMYVVFKRKIKVPELDFSAFVREEYKNIGKITDKEKIMALILGAVIVLWITSSRKYGLGGPCMFGVVLMLVFRILEWKDIQEKVRFDVVGLYAAACAMGVGLKVTGASLWLAESIINILPECCRQGNLLVVSISSFTAVMTNFMSDGATVASIGPVVLSMAEVAQVHLWKVGLACAFASSFANMMIVGTPNNAIAYVGGVDPETGERLLRLRDFFVYGTLVTGLALAVFWLSTVFGYWRFLSWN